MFKWQKLGKIFDPTEFKNIGWMNEFAQAPASLIFDDFVRVYFSCRPRPDENGQYVSRAAYIDLDRKDLFKILRVSPRPVLDLGELGTFDEFGTYPMSVIRVADVVYAYYGGWTRCESVPYNVAIGLAISHDDGESFTRFGNGPLLSYSVDEPMTISGPKIRKFGSMWYLWYVTGKKWAKTKGKPESVFKIRMASSTDGINWTRHGKDLIENRLEEDECQASPDVIFCKGKYHMFFCYKYSLNFRNKERGYRIGYASSNDMIYWVRDDLQAGIDVSDSGWDSEMIAYPHVFELDDRIYMLYLGDQVGRYGFGVAQLQDSEI
jgi:hypothetical protein